MRMFMDAVTKAHHWVRENEEKGIEPVTAFEGVIENIRDVQEDLDEEGATYIVFPLINDSYKRAGDVMLRFFEKRKCYINTRVDVITVDEKKYKYLVIFINSN